MKFSSMTSDDKVDVETLAAAVNGEHAAKKTFMRGNSVRL